MTASLYSIALESKEIDGALAIAFDQLTSDDPDEQAQAQQLIEDTLAKASANQEALYAKADAICHIYEQLNAKAQYLRDISASRLEQADREEAAAERLLDYVTKYLTMVHPGQKKFALAEHTISSRSSSGVVIYDPESIPDRYHRHAITIKLDPGLCEADVANIQTALEHFMDATPARASQWTLNRKSEPSRTAMKPDLKADPEAVPGARLETRANWSIR